MPTETDASIRQAAFDHVSFVSALRGTITSKQLAEGFQFQGMRIPLINPQRGIFKPRQMQQLLSIRTVYPRPGRRVWYDDQREAYKGILQAEEEVSYDFMGTDPDSADNRWLHQAMQEHVPLIYFLGIAPNQYQPIIPTFIVGWDAGQLKARIAFGLDETQALADQEFPRLRRNISEVGTSYQAEIPSARERRYALRAVKQRLHQTSFREAVIAAYGGRCAISGLPEPLLLDAAHIIRDQDERWGQPVIANGLPLSKVHHAAFDAHLIGIDADCKIHVSDRLLSQHDGPMLQALKQLNGGVIHPPRRDQDRPSRERLEIRFAAFKTAH